MRRPSVLYISYDGMLEPLGQSQVLAYLEKLSGEYHISLMSFEKPADLANAPLVATVRSRIAGANIRWTPLRYHKSPSVPATLYDICAGTLVGLWIALRQRVSFVHARSYLPGLMARIIKMLTGAKFLFDMRGLWADERVDGGIWPREGRVYRTVKSLERSLLLAADHIVTLTNASATEINSFPYMQGGSHPMTMISTCADLERFSPSSRPVADGFTFGYVGSVGTWYLFDEFLECFLLIKARRPDARMVVVNRNDREYILGRLAHFGIGEAEYELVAASHEDVPEFIRRMTIGGAIIKPAYSKIASAPTKLAEYLGCGVPCIGNVGVGDMEQILEGEHVGVALRDFSVADRAETIDRMFALLDEPDLAARCRATAERLFSTELGVRAYRRIYRDLAPAREA